MIVDSIAMYSPFISLHLYYLYHGHIHLANLSLSYISQCHVPLYSKRLKYCRRLESSSSRPNLFGETKVPFHFVVRGIKASAGCA